MLGILVNGLMSWTELTQLQRFASETRILALKSE
jgi:hypothetical protein